MDTLTQIALGAAVGEAVLGRKVGNQAVMWGAVGGLIPDLDVLATPFLNDVQELTFHRGITHSIAFAVVLSPLLAYLISRVHKTKAARWFDWTKLMFWSIVTHPILDCFTIYGTQIFQPFSNYAVAFNTIFIIDPLYTLPLLFSVIALMFFQRTNFKRRILNQIGLGLSCFYLCLTVINKLYVNWVFERAWRSQNISYQRYFTNPTPLNTLLWRGVAESKDGFWEGLYSLLDRNQKVEFRFIPKHHELIRPFAAQPELHKLFWFTKGYFSVSQKDGRVYLNDLRFGRTDLGLPYLDGDYLFSYRIASEGNGAGVSIERANVRVRISEELLIFLWQRIKGN